MTATAAPSPHPHAAPDALPLVVGLGSFGRGDDAIGPAVAEIVAEEAVGEVAVLVHEDPTALVEVIAEHDRVVLVDATRCGAPAGTVRVLRVDAAGPALPARTDPGAGGTHGLGLAGALALARVLDRLPEHVWVVGVEAGTWARGAPMSPEVAAAIPSAAAAVLACVREG